jgi:hypothetical protein
MSIKIFELSGDHDDDYFLSQDDMSQEHWDVLMSCYHQGACDDDARSAMRYFDIKDLVRAVNWLIETGIERDRFCDDLKYPERVTSEDQIKDVDAVYMYYLWILSGDLQERED